MKRLLQSIPNHSEDSLEVALTLKILLVALLILLLAIVLIVGFASVNKSAPLEHVFHEDIEIHSGSSQEVAFSFLDLLGMETWTLMVH